MGLIKHGSDMYKPHTVSRTWELLRGLVNCDGKRASACLAEGWEDAF